MSQWQVRNIVGQQGQQLKNLLLPNAIRRTDLDG
jgi:hypothetical protein